MVEFSFQREVTPGRELLRHGDNVRVGPDAARSRFKVFTGALSTQLLSGLRTR